MATCIGWIILYKTALAENTFDIFITLGILPTFHTFFPYSLSVSSTVGMPVYVMESGEEQNESEPIGRGLDKTLGLRIELVIFALFFFFLFKRINTRIQRWLVYTVTKVS